MKKSLLKIIILLVLLAPFGVFADEKPLAILHSEELLDVVSPNRTLNITSIKSLPEYMLYGFSSLRDDLGYDRFSDVIRNYIRNLDSVKSYYASHPDKEYNLSVFCNSYTKCGVYFFENGFDDVEYYEANKDNTSMWSDYPSPYMQEFIVSISIDTNRNSKVYNMLKKEFGHAENGSSSYCGETTCMKQYYIYDLQYINTIYNSNNTNVFNCSVGAGCEVENNVMKLFPELKNIYEQYPGIKFEFAQNSAMGGGFWENFQNISANFVTFYDNTAYMINTLVFHNAPILLISNDVSDTSDGIITAATNRIKNYINNDNVNVSITNISSNYTSSDLQEINDNISRFLNGALNTNEVNYSSNVYKLQLGTLSTNLYIVRVDSSLVKDLDVESFNIESGVRITTSSSDVILDSSLEVDDVTDNYKQDPSVTKAYDISLYSLYKDGYVTKIKDGLKIMIPVNNDFSRDSKKIYYIDAKGNLSQSFDYEIVTIDSQKYVVFETDHLSTYAIVDSDSISNPNTGDSIIIFAVLLGIALATIVVSRKKIKLN